MERRAERAGSEGGIVRRPGKPREVPYGLRVRAERGRIGRTWWSQRWLRALEEIGLGGRLERGRRYARRGQVVELSVEVGRARAKVQGTRATPYNVDLALRSLSEDEWRAVIERLSTQALYVAKLLAGELPREIEEVFAEVGVPLFPEARGDLRTSCSCPDEANPCKHIAAVYYLLADSFDRDPFLLLKLRGRGKEEVLEALRSRRGASATEESDELRVTGVGEIAEERVKRFWTMGESAKSFTIRPQRPGEHMALVRRLGKGPFRHIKVADVLGAAYDIMSAAALEEARR